MERGYVYHANFIYNQPKIRIERHRNGDQKLSLDIVKHAVDKMESWGLKETYYHDRDAMPGSNVFTEFFKTVKQSRFTIVVVTKGFLNDSWTKYKSQSAFLKLLEADKAKRFIAFYVNIDECHIPDELNVMVPICFDQNWKINVHAWEQLKMQLFDLGSTPVQDTGRDPYPAITNTRYQPQKSTVGHQNILISRAVTVNNSPLTGVQGIP